MVPGVATPAALDDELVAELARGISVALGLYAELGFESFNLALYGLPDSHPLLLRLLCRQSPRPFYRSDVMYLERLRWEAAVDLTPEDLAGQAGGRFRG